MPYKDLEKRRECARLWAQKSRRENPDAHRAYQRAYYAGDLEKARAKGRRNYTNNCEVRQAQSKRWKSANVEHVRRYAVRNRDIMVIAKGNICWDCGGEFMSRQLHFHHRDPKTKVREVAKMVGYDVAVLRAEIAKCDVLCENCHRLAHKK